MVFMNPSAVTESRGEAVATPACKVTFGFSAKTQGYRRATHVGEENVKTALFLQCSLAQAGNGVLV